MFRDGSLYDVLSIMKNHISSIPDLEEEESTVNSPLLPPEDYPDDNIPVSYVRLNNKTKIIVIIIGHLHNDGLLHVHALRFFKLGGGGGGACPYN